MPDSFRKLASSLTRILGLRRRTGKETEVDSANVNLPEGTDSTHVPYTITCLSATLEPEGVDSTPQNGTKICDVYLHRTASGNLPTEEDLAILSRMLNDPIRGRSSAEYVVHREE